MNKCPLFEKCGGCKFDFTAGNYSENKIALLKKIPTTSEPIWITPGHRRRADFSFLDGVFGFFEQGSKNIVPVNHCPALCPELNDILPVLAKMPWAGSGRVLVTLCDNGVDVFVTSGVPYFNSDFKNAADKSPAIRVTWNDRVVSQSAQPKIKFGDTVVDFPAGAFLQPSIIGEQALRDLVNAAAVGARKVADLFCGQGSFSFALNADGFDIAGGINRDLFKKPLTVQNLKKYDCVIMDPPRAGAMAQSKELAKSTVEKIIYVSCNPDSFMRDKQILERGGFVLKSLTPVDQFPGSAHWELVGIFTK